MMNPLIMLFLCAVYFIAGTISVSTGGMTIITVPLLISLGIASKDAVAVNMFALTFLSIAGSFGFRQEMKNTSLKTIVLLSIITAIGSLLGAKMLIFIDNLILKRIIAAMCFTIALLLIFNKNIGLMENRILRGSKTRFIIGLLFVFLLSIYGGFFSGGYVTLLSFVLILFFGSNFLKAAFITKVLNTFSSFAACLIFYKENLIDFRLGIPLAISMGFGALVGAKMAVAKGTKWIRGLFIFITLVLAVKLLIF